MSVLTIEFETADELKAKIADMAGALGVIGVTCRAVTNAASDAPEVAVEATPQTVKDAPAPAEKRGRGRPKTVEAQGSVVAGVLGAAATVAAGVPTGAPTPAPTAPIDAPSNVDELTAGAPTATALTIENARQALTDVLQKKGADKARQILTEFTVARISDLKPEQFEAFVSAAKKALK